MVRATDIDIFFPEMIRRLRRRYSLYYRLPEGATQGEREVRVELSYGVRRLIPAATVLARAKYRPEAERHRSLAVRQ
jgi:hypothetical protein